MQLNLNINKEQLIKELSTKLDAVDFNMFILELLRYKYYQVTEDTYNIHDIEYLINDIKNKYIT